MGGTGTVQCCRDFVEAEIEGAGVLDTNQLAKLKERAILIEMEEPPQLSALTRVCQNELAFATGHKEQLTKLSSTESSGPIGAFPLPAQRQP